MVAGVDQLVLYAVIAYLEVMRSPFRVLLLSLLTFTLASQLPAFQGRPLSDLVADDRMPCEIVAAASDGHDFLVVCDLFLEGTWGQVISGDGAAGPLFLIGKGMGIGGTSAVWNGSSYTVTWCGASYVGTYATTISRNGSVSEPALILDRCGAKLAANGDRVLLVTHKVTPEPRQVVGMLLDGDARPTSSPRVLFTGDTTDYDVAATNDGFALGTFGYAKTSLTRIDRDGKPKGAPVVVEGPYAGTAPDYHSSAGVVASDGENVLLAFHAHQPEQRSELRTAIVAADSTIQRAPAAVFTVTGAIANNTITPTSIFWNGSSYVAGMAVIRQWVDVDAEWLRIDRNGERIGDVEVLANAYGPSLASNGRDYIVAFTGTPSGGAPATPSYALASPDALTPRTPFLPAGRSLGAHVKVAIGAMRDQYLAAWTEKYGAAWRVRASRLDRDGRYLDGAGIVLGTLGSRHSIAVDSDGTNWLVALGSFNGALSAARISTSGRLLDAQPIDLGYGDEVSVRWGNGVWMVMATSNGSLVAIPVSSDGAPGTRRVLGAYVAGQYTETDPTLSYTNPAVAFEGNRFLAGAIHHSEYRPDTVQPMGIDDMTFRMTRVDTNGQAVEGPPAFIADSYSPTLSLASNGTKSMAVFSKWGKVIGVLLPERTEIELSGSGPADVTWDGHDFVVAYKPWNKNGLSIARITPQGVVSQEIETHFAADERPTEIVLAGGADAPLLLGFVASHTGWNGVARASAAFLSEVQAAAVPPAPAPLRAAPSRDRVRIQWTPMPDALGISVELRLPDGTYRPIGVAAGAAADAEIPLGGLTGNAIRLRAWNSAGTGEASGDVAIMPARQRAARK
jgi:hypothetical protein